MSDFLRRKHTSYFRKYDINKDGFLTTEDYLLLADRFCENEAPDSPRRTYVREKFTQFFGKIASLGSTHGKVSEKEWLEALEKAAKTPEFKKVLEEAKQACFTTVDTDGDGYIDEKEYVRFLYHQQVDDCESVGREAFRTLGLNGDGRLSSAAFHDVIMNYFCSEDESLPGTFFLGPLI